MAHQQHKKSTNPMMIMIEFIYEFTITSNQISTPKKVAIVAVPSDGYYCADIAKHIQLGQRSGE